MLLFKKKFIQPILSGKKTQTIRLWRKSRVRVGQRSYIPGVGYITIDSVDLVQLDALSEEDARLDGFPNADALRAELNTIYAEQLRGGFQTFRIRFTRLPEAEQVRITQERKKLKESLKRSLQPPASRLPSPDHYEKTMEKLKKIVKNAEESH